MRHAQGGEIGHQRAGSHEAEVAAQLEPVGGPQRAQVARLSTSAECATSLTSERAAKRALPGWWSGSAVFNSRSHAAPKRRAGNRNALSSPPALVAAQEHRRTLGEQQRGKEVALLARTQRQDLGVVGRALHAAVPRAVVIAAVAASLEVRLVVLLVVRDEIAQREAVVRGDEVDRRERVAAVVLVEVRRAGETRGEVAERGLAAPEVAHRVAVHAVPLGPEHREVADLVAAGA